MTLEEILEKLPATIKINNREGDFCLTHTSEGWYSTYIYYEFDLTPDKDYNLFPTALEAVENLWKRLPQNILNPGD